ncbi:MAG: SDR family oxidoreductase [Microbacteriaceae bacterium]|nr:SDR family oxidoreductase [Microbacteriaceae bacterium]
MTSSDALSAFSLRGKVVVITGGFGLYGSVFTAALLRAGATVVPTTTSPERLAEGRAALETGLSDEQCVRLVPRVLDLRDTTDVARVIDEVDATFGRIDVLVNNAVVRAGAGLFDTTLEDWLDTSRVNSAGLFDITRRVAAGMVARGDGAIINVGSIYGLIAPDFRQYEGTGGTSPAFYNFDKAGMIGFTKYLAAELGPHGVRVNCLCPGGLGEDGDDSPMVAAYSARTPLRRMARGTDVEGPMVFLASDASRYITGAVLPVDGGRTAL